MIFWVVTVLFVALWAWAVIYFTRDDGIVGFLMAFLMGGMIAVLVWFLVAVALVGVAGSHLAGANKTETHSVPLKALGSDSSVGGRSYFLAGGYVEGKRVLSYIRENSDGSFTPGQVDARSTRVFEEDQKPELVWHVHSARHWWLFPADVEISRSYELYVPEGSVSEEYNVAP